MGLLLDPSLALLLDPLLPLSSDEKTSLCPLLFPWPGEASELVALGAGLRREWTTPAAFRPSHFNSTSEDG